MKTFRLIGMAIIAILFSVSFAACSSDDDEDGTNSIEGEWYLKSEKWYENYSDGTPNLNNISFEDFYGDYSDERVWVITKKADDTYELKETTKERDGSYSTKTWNFITISKNVYQIGNDRMTIKSVSSTEMVIYYEDHYFDTVDPGIEYGTYTFMR